MQNTNQITKRFALPGILLLVGACTSSHADELSANAVAELNEATLTANEAAQVDHTLADSNTVTSEELERWSATDLEDIFRSSISVNAAGGRPQTQDIFIRGLQSTTANVTVDGAPQVGAIFYHAGTGGSIEPELLKSVKVSAGTGNALSGAGALGGAIAYETKDGFDLLEDGATVGALLKGTYYSSGDGGYKTSATGYGLINEDWSYIASLGYSDVGNYEDGDGNEVIDTEYQRTSAFFKVSGNLTEAQSLSVSYEYLEDQSIGAARMNIAPAVSADGTSYKERNTATVHYDINPANNDWVNVETNAYWTERSLQDATTETSITSIGFDLRNTSLFKEAAKVTYGVDYREDTYETDKTTAGDDAGDVLGLYAQGDWDVSEFVTLSAGGRFDRYTLDERGGVDVDNSGFSPNGTIIVRPTEGLEIHATYAEALRGAYPTQAYFDTVTQDPDMKAERSTNLELGFEYTIKNYYIAANIFQLEVDDVINPGYDRGTGLRTNVGDFETTGYEIMAGAQFGALNVELGVTESDPEMTYYDGSSDEEYSLVGTNTGRTWFGNLEYVFEELNLITGWYVSYVEAIDSDTARALREKSSYTVHDAYLRWTPKSLDALTVNLTLSNVFDKYYYDQATFAYTSGYAASGRELALSLSYKF
ncbi:TonB-dependent receptor [Coraliomargarita algicola]|uniref:TonB-dependent receptor n=1 Tax=Coraliomargarita algicola TaxID=3092156 RepID=A0ABZ0RRX0_9BACT|nr:TonB-dependent receptor [Coraliomargarita sp. J2-16]WPJ97989.1 TonB-dependent receptor [Coraliomargarita sp. J2-16]